MSAARVRLTAIVLDNHGLGCGEAPFDDPLPGDEPWVDIAAHAASSGARPEEAP